MHCAQEAHRLVPPACKHADLSLLSVSLWTLVQYGRSRRMELLRGGVGRRRRGGRSTIYNLVTFVQHSGQSWLVVEFTATRNVFFNVALTAGRWLLTRNAAHRTTLVSPSYHSRTTLVPTLVPLSYRIAAGRQSAPPYPDYPLSMQPGVPGVTFNGLDEGLRNRSMTKTPQPVVRPMFLFLAIFCALLGTMPA